jgi:hypothetical protein
MRVHALFGGIPRSIGTVSRSDLIAKMCVIDWTAMGTWALVIVGALAAYFTWALVFVGAIAAYFAYRTASSAIAALQVNRSSVDIDIFLKASAIVDDEEKFGPNYDLVKENTVQLQQASLADNGNALAGIEEPYDSKLPNAVQDVLSAMEKVGIIFHYATSKEMIQEYIGDVVINSYDALHHVIKIERDIDPEMYERFEEVYKFCKTRWRPGAAARVRYTNIS